MLHGPVLPVPYVMFCHVPAGALAGNPFGVDRQFIAKELGFIGGVCPNSMDAVSDRDYVLDTLYFVAVHMTHLSRWAEDLIIYSSGLFKFVQCSDAYATGEPLRGAGPRQPLYPKMVLLCILVYLRHCLAWRRQQLDAAEEEPRCAGADPGEGWPCAGQLGGVAGGHEGRSHHLQQRLPGGVSPCMLCPAGDSIIVSIKKGTVTPLIWLRNMIVAGHNSKTMQWALQAAARVLNLLPAVCCRVSWLREQRAKLRNKALSAGTGFLLLHAHFTERTACLQAWQLMFDSVDTANDCIRIATGVLSTIKINPKKMLAGLSPDMLATDLAEYLVRKGTPQFCLFRIFSTSSAHLPCRFVLCMILHQGVDLCRSLLYPRTQALCCSVRKDNSLCASRTCIKQARICYRRAIQRDTPHQWSCREAGRGQRRDAV